MKDFQEGAKLAAKLSYEAKKENDKESYKFYRYLFCKRRYLAIRSRYYECRDKHCSEQVWNLIECKAKATIRLLADKVPGCDDLLVMLHLYSSHSCLNNRKLISAERDVEEALDLLTDFTVNE